MDGTAVDTSSLIPNWTMAGVIPPVHPHVQGHDPKRSPYECSLADFVKKFSKTAARIRLLEKFVEYRAELYRRGILNGFQWIDGSFTENVEDQQNRSPNDIDVVTYFLLPEGETQKTFWPKISDLFYKNAKTRWSVDAYPYVLGKTVDALQIKQISYWYSMWSHKRDSTWKGFVQVNLSPVDDLLVEAEIASLRRK